MNRTKPEPDKLPPNTPEMELALLSACLAEPEICLNECEEWGVSPDWFYDLRWQQMYRTMMGLHQEGKTFDSVLLYQALKAVEAKVDWMELVSALPDHGLPSQLPGYLEVLREQRLLRASLALAAKVARAVYETDQGTPDQLVDEATAAWLKLSEAKTKSGERTFNALMPAAVAEMEDYHRGHAQIVGLTTGLDYLDKLTCGIGGKHGNYIVLSARPGMGKSSLALQIAKHAALAHVWFEPKMENGKPVTEKDEHGIERPVMTSKRGLTVAVFSLEMKAEAVVERMLFQESRVNIHTWRNGFAGKTDMERLSRASAVLNTDKILVDDEPRCTIETLKAKARRLHRANKVGLFVVDYIQLMRSSRTRFRDDRVQEVAEISAELQLLGKELNTPIIIIAQMNRDFEKDPHRRPRLSDLKDCGGIEQDADVVGFLYYPKLKAEESAQFDAALERVYGKDPGWTGYPQRQNLLIAKQRYGPSGKEAQLLFDGSCTLYYDYVQWLKENGAREMAAGDPKPKPQQQELT